MAETVRELLRQKPGEVVTIEPDKSVLDAVRLMAERDIGAVPVLEGERLIGVLTERHYARNVILAGRRSDTTPIREVMSTDLVPVPPSETIDRCMALMTENRIRHLPVIGGRPPDRHRLHRRSRAQPDRRSGGRHRRAHAVHQQLSERADADRRRRHGRRESVPRPVPTVR